MSKSVMRSLVVIGLAVSGAMQAHAATSWSFTTGGAETGAGSFGNTRSYTSGVSSKVTVSAWSDTKNAGITPNKFIESAYLGSWAGGLGVTNRDGVSGAGDAAEGTITNTQVPGHTMDNNSRFDSMLFDFGAGKAAKLNSVTVGWWTSDSDITVLAYTGNGTPTFTASNQAYASLLSSGWSVVKSSAGATGTAHYSNAAGGALAESTDKAKYVPLAVNDLNISARYWLVGALNTLVQSLPASTSVNKGDDYVKIAGVSASYDTPEPSSMVLASGALVGVVLMRRRRKG